MTELVVDTPLKPAVLYVDGVEHAAVVDFPATNRIDLPFGRHRLQVHSRRGRAITNELIVDIDADTRLRLREDPACTTLAAWGIYGVTALPEHAWRLDLDES